MIVTILCYLWLSKEDAIKCFCVVSCVKACAQFGDICFIISYRFLGRNNTHLFVALHLRLLFFSSMPFGGMLPEADAMDTYLISLLNETSEKLASGLLYRFPKFLRFLLATFILLPLWTLRYRKVFSTKTSNALQQVRIVILKQLNNSSCFRAGRDEIDCRLAQTP